MLRRPPAPRHPWSHSAVRSRSRHTCPVPLGHVTSEQPVTLPWRSDPQLRLDGPLYCLLDAEGALCTGQVWQGECVLLFTSPAAAAAFAVSTEVQAQSPRVFSRSRPEFLTQAGRSFEQGLIGGLIDPTARTGETAFLGFDVDRRQGGAPPG